MEPIITRPDAADIEAAAELAVRAWTPIREIFRRDIGDELYEAFFTGWQESKKAGIRQQLSAGRGYVTKLDGKVVGFISYRVDGKIGEIQGNAVDPDCRGMGLGTAQYRFVLDRMKEEGAEFACVYTGGDDGHAPARRAYEAVGFEAYLPSRKYFKKL